MKKILWAGAAGLLIGLPGVCRASTLTFETCGSQYQLLFDPQGNGGCDLPQSCFYRSYNCVIGSKPVYPTIIFTPPPPPKGNNVPCNPNPPSNPTKGDVNPPCPPDNGPTTPTNGGCDTGGGGCEPSAVPAPDSAAMAGAGLAAMALIRWFRSRRTGLA